jgi:hypothetical protein
MDRISKENDGQDKQRTGWAGSLRGRISKIGGK